MNDQTPQNRTEKYIFDVAGAVPHLGDAFPFDWKCDDYKGRYTKIDKKEMSYFRWKVRNFSIVAENEIQAETKLRDKLRSLYQDVPNSPYDQTKEEWGGIGGIHYQEVSNRERKLAVRIHNYKDIHSFRIPLYVVDANSEDEPGRILGVAISFRDIDKMLKKDELPRVFIEHPELIPVELRIPIEGKKDWRAEQVTDCLRYNGETLIPDLQSRILWGLLFEDKNALSNYHSLGKETTKALEESVLFPDELDFWVYSPKRKTRFEGHLEDPRFLHFSWTRYHHWSDAFLAPKIPSMRDYFIGTEGEVEDYIVEHSMQLIKGHKQAVEDIERLKEIRLGEAKSLLV